MRGTIKNNGDPQRAEAVKISEKSMRLLEELVDIPKGSEPGLEDFRFSSAMKEVGG